MILSAFLENSLHTFPDRSESEPVQVNDHPMTVPQVMGPFSGQVPDRRGPVAPLGPPVSRKTQLKVTLGFN